MAMPKAYEGNEPYIFISYAHKDSDKVIPIIQALQDRGFRVWFDAGIEAGSEWPAYIAMHLSNCGCFIPFLTPNYMASDNCRQEIYFALRKKRTLLPVYLEEADLDIGLEMQLSPIQALMLQKSMGTDALLQEMCKSAKLQPCMGNNIAVPPKQPTPEEEFDGMLTEWVALMSCQIMIGEEFDIHNTRRLFAMAKKLGRGAESICALGDALYAAKDYASAAECYRVAADVGHTRATKNLGVCYYQGSGVQMDHKEAATLIQLAAGQGDREAQHFLGILYEEGHGVPQSLATAIFWFQEAGKSEDVRRCQSKLQS